MKKKTIGTIAVVMGLSFLALLYLQLKYMESMVKMKKEQFDESVNKALYQASHKLELNETRWFLEKMSMPQSAGQSELTQLGHALVNLTGLFKSLISIRWPARMEQSILLSS